MLASLTGECLYAAMVTASLAEDMAVDVSTDTLALVRRELYVGTARPVRIASITRATTISNKVKPRTAIARSVV
jgi:hypothetical protein